MATLHDLLASRDRIDDSLAAHGLPPAADRYEPLLARLRDALSVGPDAPVWLASASGRTELAGNHTDHNHGRVLAASITLDTIAACTRTDDGRIRIASEGFAPLDIDATDLAIHPGERGTTAALARGIAAGFVRNGLRAGGFTAAVSSTVLAGSGLSSSASVEVLIGTILDRLYSDGRAGATLVASIGQFAENTYFGKPCGLMDQVACASGGAVSIDFADPERPLIERVQADFRAAGLALLVVDTGASHADLTDEYAAIPADMRAVAAALGAEVLGGVDRERFLARLPELRRRVGDRAVARALHFYGENPRVARMVDALKARRMDDYLALMADSGRSSGLFLQNCVPQAGPAEQGVVLALALTEEYLTGAGLANGRGAACRVHGGGFAGTIQVLLPAERVAEYRTFIEQYLGVDAATELGVRNTPAVAFTA